MGNVSGFIKADNIAGGFSDDNDLQQAHIPTNNNQLDNGAGYITAAEVPSAGLDATNVTSPLQIDSGKNLKINYDRGLTNWLDRLEVKLGDRMAFDNNGAITSDAPPEAVAAFSPITIVDETNGAIATARGEQRINSLWSGSFTIPDGVTEFSCISRCRISLESKVDQVVVADGTQTYPVIWANEPGFEIEFTSGVSGTNKASARIARVGTTPKTGRGNGGFCIRMNLFTVPGTGNRTISWSASAFVADSHGGSPSQADILYNGYNMLIFPTA